LQENGVHTAVQLVELQSFAPGLSLGMFLVVAPSLFARGP